MRFLALVLCFASIASGQDLSVKSRTYYQLGGTEGVTAIGDRFFFETMPAVTVKPVGVIRVESEAANVEVVASDANRLPVAVERLQKNVYVIQQAGQFWVDITAIDFEKNLYGRKTVVVVVGDGPAPTPVPPGPTPGPTPGPSPIEGAGLRVLFVHETGEPLPREFEESFYSPEIASYLNTHCENVDGHPEFRRVDPDTKFTDPNHRFAKALERPRTTCPWLIISNGTSGYEGPFPATKSETLELIKRFAPTQKPAPAKAAPPVVKVTMITRRNCPPCEIFKLNEAPKLGGLLTITDTIPMGVSVYSFPTFVVQASGKQVVLTNVRTAEQIRAAITRLGAN